MSYNIKPLQQQVGYRFQNISFNEDGSLSTSIQFGTLSQKPALTDQDAPAVTFNPLAQQGHYLQKTEVDALLGAPITEGETGGLRDILESRLEAILRQKENFNL